MSPVYDVFLSHSSADKPAVEKLAHKLIEAKVNPFLDKWHLIPGEPWEEALEEALDQSRTCAVFVGPTGLGPWQNEEMRSALEDRVRNKAFRVIPVLLPGSLEPQGEKLPRFLRRLTWVDFRAGLEDEDAFRRLVHGIQGTSPGPGGGGGGPVSPPSPISYRCMAQPPEGFIHRSEYDTVLEALCPKDGTAQVSPSVGITTALRGAGGFGKTALAQAICFDERIRQQFPDGILWTTMGDDLGPESRLSRILDLIRWWTNTEPPGFKDLQAAGSKFREILLGQRVLVVVDDVWYPSDVSPFQGFGNGSAILITTRDSQTLPGNSVRVEVDAMASSEAVSLLRFELPDGQDSEIALLAAQLGEWPLLLKLVNRQLRELVKEGGLTFSKALQEIKSALDAEGFSAFDRDDPESRHAAASRTILVSVGRLPEKDRDLYFQLAVFPEDAEIPLGVLEGYWNLSQFATRKLCRRLHDLSLLRDFGVKRGAIRLHDVIRKILVEQIGDIISYLHVQLLETYRPTSGDWMDLDTESWYLWRNLAGHLMGSRRSAELRDLLVDFSFLEAKLKATDINALISDYAGLAGEDPELRLIQAALRLSAHILGRDRRQLASQLLGRLLDRKEEHIQELVEGARSWQGEFWLRPRTASFTQPGGALIRVLEGHTDWVNAVAALAGRRAVSASADRTLRVWSLESGRTLQTLEGHRASVNAVAVIGDWGAISASNDGTIRIWDLGSGRTLQTLEGHNGSVLAVAVLDGGRIASASDDWTLRIWDLESGRTLQTLSGHEASVNAVALLDDQHVISASDDGTLRVWNLESQRTIRILDYKASVLAMTLLDSQRVGFGSDDGAILVWDLGSGRVSQILEGYKTSILALAKLDDQRVIFASDDGKLQVLDLKRRRILQTLEGHKDSALTVAVLEDSCAISGSAEGTLRVWDLESGRVFQTLEEHTASVINVAVLDSQRAVSNSDDGIMHIWDLVRGRILWNQDHSGLSIRNFNKRILRVWDLVSGHTVQTLEVGKDSVRAVAELDSHLAVSAFVDGTLQVWDRKSGRILQILKGHTAWVLAIAMLDGRRAVSASNDGTLRVWDLDSGDMLTVMTLDALPTAVAVSRARRIVVVGDQVGKVHFFDWVNPEDGAAAP